MSFTQFQKLIQDYYRKQGRQLLWRPPLLKPRKDGTLDSYKIVVSEVMLQQTQVSRVEKKFPEFIATFPNFKALAQTDTTRLLRVWQGMGYNRRALNLRKLAQEVITAHKGQLPSNMRALDALPGIGPNTAGSIRAFAFNLPSVFIETNIRRVFIHHFFANKKNVHDEQILELVEKTLPKENIREWYYALMDYGSHLAGKVENPNRKSAHYTKQSKFEGSNRQLRGALLRTILKGEVVDQSVFAKKYQKSAAQIRAVLADLKAEGFIN